MRWPPHVSKNMKLTGGLPRLRTYGDSPACYLRFTAKIRNDAAQWEPTQTVIPALIQSLKQKTVGFTKNNLATLRVSTINSGVNLDNLRTVTDPYRRTPCAEAAGYHQIVIAYLEQSPVIFEDLFGNQIEGEKLAYYF